MSWTNDDGLVVRFGAADVVAPKVSNEAGVMERMIVRLTDATALQTNATNPLTTSLAYFKDETSPVIPANSYITRAYFCVTTAFTSGGSAVLDIGLVRADSAGAHIDIDAIDDGIAVAALGANAIVNCNGAGVAGVVKTSDTYDSYVSFSYETAAFTAGAGYLVVEYIPGNVV